MMFGPYTDLFTRANLVLNVNSRCRIVADPHRRESGTYAAFVYLGLDVVFDPGG